MVFSVGLDWGWARHAACVVDDTGKAVAHFDVLQTRAGLAGLVAALRKFGPADTLPVAIERPNGLVVDTLVAAGHPVFPLHPNSVAACRPRYRAARSKSDASDAYILADVLRTDRQRLRPLAPPSDELKALRSLGRTRGALVRTRVHTTNELRELLMTYWPGAAELFCELDSDISLAFLERYGGPSKEPTPRQMKAFLQTRGYTGRQKPEALVAKLRAAAQGLVGPHEERLKAIQAKALVAVLRALVEQIKGLTTLIEEQVAASPTAQIVASLPRAGKSVNTAKLVAEIGDPKRFVSADHLAAEAGVAPVTNESGKFRAVGFRSACNRHLREALTCLADQSRHASAWAKDVYVRARARGCRHPHAIRILARAWARVLWRLLQTGEAYDPARHRAAIGFQTDCSMEVDTE